MEANVLHREPESPFIPIHGRHGVDKRQYLTDQGSHGDHGDTAVQNIDKQCGKSQLYQDDDHVQPQDPFGMAAAPGNGNVNRIEEVDHQGQNFNAEIPGPCGNQIFRSPQKTQEGLCKGDQYHRHHNADDDGHSIHGGHAAADGFVITAAVGFGDFDAAAHRKTGAQSRDHQGDLAQAGHSRHRVGSNVRGHQCIQNFENTLKCLE